MNKVDDFSSIVVINSNNKYIVDEFIKYYKFIYSTYGLSTKTAKENYYKLQTIKKIIEVLKNYKSTIKSGKEFESIKGIGEKTIARIDEIINTGKLSEIIDTSVQIKAVSELASIYGIGPSKASEFYEKYGIKTIKELLKKDKEGEIVLTNQMKLGIKYKKTLVEEIPRVLISRFENYIQEQLYKNDKSYTSIICGSYRRGKDFSSDIDILITHKKLKSKKNAGIILENVINIFEKSIIIDKLTESFNTHFQGFASFKDIPELPDSYDKNKFNIKKNVIRIDIIVIPTKYFYTALMHFTGSGDFNQKMRVHAKKLNMKLSEYGLLKIEEDHKEVEIPIKSEVDIFDALLLKYIPPEKR